MIQEKLNQALGMAGIATQLYKQTPEYQEKMRIKGIKEQLGKNLMAQKAIPEEIKKTMLETFALPAGHEDVTKNIELMRGQLGDLGKLSNEAVEMYRDIGEYGKAQKERKKGQGMLYDMTKLFDTAAQYSANMQAQQKRQANRQRKAYAQTYASDSGFANYLRGVKGPEQGGNK